MVNSVSFGSTYRNGSAGLNRAYRTTVPAKKITQEDVSKLIKYANGETLKEVPDTFSSTTTSAAKSAVLWEALPFAGLLKNAKAAKSTGDVAAKLRDLDKATRQSLKNIFTGNEGTFGSRVKDYFSTIENNKKVYQGLKSSTKLVAKSSGAQKLATKAATMLEKNPKSIIGKALNTISKKKSAAAAAKLAKLGTTQTASTTANIAGKVGRFGKVGKLMKTSGAGAMLAINAAIETFTEVVPTFKELGAKKGMKQVGKSAVKVGLTTAGYIAGAKGGAALGAAIGSVFPGVGTAIGGAIGFVGGLLGSFVAGKIAGKITGKSERQIAKEQQEKAGIQQQQRSCQTQQQAGKEGHAPFAVIDQQKQYRPYKIKQHTHRHDRIGDP